MLTDNPPAMVLEEFEHVLAAPGTALLRVLAHRPPQRDSDQRPTLLAADGETVHRFAPLPAPADPSGTLRAAYPVPLPVLGPQSSYALELAGGGIVDLPTPTPGSRRVALRARRNQDREAADRIEREALQTAGTLADADATLADAASGAAASAREAAAAQALAATLGVRVTDLEAGVLEQVERNDALERGVADTERERSRLEHELSTAQAARARLEHELDHARDGLKVMTAECDELTRQVDAHDAVAIKARERARHAEDARNDVAAALRELETWPAELERRLTETTTELGVVNEARQEAEREVKDLAAALVDARATVKGLRGELEAAQASAHNANVEVVRLTAEAQARAQAETELRDAT